LERFSRDSALAFRFPKRLFDGIVGNDFMPPLYETLDHSTSHLTQSDKSNLHGLSPLEAAFLKRHSLA
jgi:hypothetical protein